MLVIGHRGSQGTYTENTIESLHEAIRTGADMIEFDIRLTKDKVPVLSHNLRLFGTRKRELTLLRRYTYEELKARAEAKGYSMTSLDTVMKECFGKIFLNIELKENGAVGPAIDVIESYIEKKSDWDSILFSSFRPLTLLAIRKRLPHVALGMLHYRNPFIFIAWHKVLRLSAVGFHRLYISRIAIESAKNFGLFSYAYTVNRKDAVDRLGARGIDGVVTDFPSDIVKSLNKA